MSNESINLTYVAINQIHLELIDRLEVSNIFKQRLKYHLNGANKIMSEHAQKIYDADEKGYNEISRFSDVLLEVIQKEGFANIYAILKCVKDNKFEYKDD